MRAKFLILCAALAGLAIAATQDSASACCKAQFEPNKPHVNVGTLGYLPSSGQQSGQSSSSSNTSRTRLRGTAPRERDRRELLIMVTPTLTTPTN